MKIIKKVASIIKLAILIGILYSTHMFYTGVTNGFKSIGDLIPRLPFGGGTERGEGKGEGKGKGEAIDVEMSSEKHVGEVKNEIDNKNPKEIGKEKSKPLGSKVLEEKDRREASKKKESIVPTAPVPRPIINNINTGVNYYSYIVTGAILLVGLAILVFWPIKKINNRHKLLCGGSLSIPPFSADNPSNDNAGNDDGNKSDNVNAKDGDGKKNPKKEGAGKDRAAQQINVIELELLQQESGMMVPSDVYYDQLKAANMLSGSITVKDGLFSSKKPARGTQAEMKFDPAILGNKSSSDSIGTGLFIQVDKSCQKFVFGEKIDIKNADVSLNDKWDIDNDGSRANSELKGHEKAKGAIKNGTKSNALKASAQCKDQKSLDSNASEIKLKNKKTYEDLTDKTEEVGQEKDIPNLLKKVEKQRAKGGKQPTESKAKKVKYDQSNQAKKKSMQDTNPSNGKYNEQKHDVSVNKNREVKVDNDKLDTVKQQKKKSSQKSKKNKKDAESCNNGGQKAGDKKFIKSPDGNVVVYTGDEVSDKRTFWKMVDDCADIVYGTWITHMMGSVVDDMMTRSARVCNEGFWFAKFCNLSRGLNMANYIAISAPLAIGLPMVKDVIECAMNEEYDAGSTGQFGNSGGKSYKKLSWSKKMYKRMPRIGEYAVKSVSASVAMTAINRVIKDSCGKVWDMNSFDPNNLAPWCTRYVLTVGATMIVPAIAAAASHIAYQKVTDLGSKLFWAKKKVEDINDTITDTARAVRNPVETAKRAVNSVKDTVSTVSESAGGALTERANEVASVVQDTANKAVSTVQETTTAAINSAQQAINDAIAN